MKKYILIFILIILLLGCAYYNTFYNAKKFFEQARSQKVGRDGKPTADAIQKYNKAIKKCGIILTEYKNSKYADDALFMLAQSLFYKGKNYIQAIEKFEDLIKYYPNSEFLPEAKLFIIKANYKLNNKSEAFSGLLDFISDPSLSDYHSQAYFLLAKYHFDNEDYSEAEQYFQKIVDKFPKSEEYEKSYFLLGKTFHEAEDFAKSNEVFFKLLKAKISRKTKMDARYYIALNFLLQEKYEEALKFAQKLVKDEYRIQKIPPIKLLIARSLAGLKRTEEAINLFDAIIADNPRTAVSAEAAFFAGEMYFNILHDYEKAIEYYGKVQSEYRNSEFVKQALSKSAVASQIIQYYNPNSEIATEELVNQQFKLAEFYFETLNLPDSAMIVYDKILERKNILSLELDSLLIHKDSLIAQLDTFRVADSTTATDSVSFEITSSDSVAADSSSSEEKILDKKTLLKTELQKTENKIKSIKDDIDKFNTEIIPRIIFTKLWLYKNLYNDSLRTEEFFRKLENNYPENRFTEAARLLIKKQPTLPDSSEEKNDLEIYKEAVKLLDSEPEIAVKKLISITTKPNDPLALKAAYTIGYIEYFILNDSLTAKTYFDSILTKNPDSEFSSEIKKFYDGNSFIKLEQLPYLQELKEKEAKKQETESSENENETESSSIENEPMKNIEENQETNSLPEQNNE